MEHLMVGRLKCVRTRLKARESFSRTGSYLLQPAGSFSTCIDKRYHEG